MGCWITLSLPGVGVTTLIIGPLLAKKLVLPGVGVTTLIIGPLLAKELVPLDHSSGSIIPFLPE